MRECKHPTCGETCRREKKIKNHRFIKVPSNVPHSSLSVPMLLNITQDLANELARLKDQNNGCISCENGKVKHAGHFFAQGKFSGVRFDYKININGQCDYCNTVLEGNLAQYHAGLIARYGAEAVKELEERANATKMYKWCRSELLELIEFFKSEIQKLK